MAFESLWDQERAKGILQGYLSTGRIANAYLFAGPKGVGKRTAARLMAQALNCETAPGHGCGACPSCAAIAADRHPDLLLCQPERGSLIIGIDQIRALRSAVALKPSQGRYKVAVIAMAERMSHEAANALLKTLEEPPAKTVIILTASMPDVLQKTIVSRCQRVPFGLVKRATIEAVLTKRFGLSEEQADLWATVSGGRLGVAIEEAENNQFKLRETSLTCLMKLLRGEASPVAMAETVVDLASHMQEEMKRQAHQEVKRMKEEHQEAETSAAEDKIEAGFQARYRAWVEDLIDTFSVWFRDALVLAHRGDDGLLINKDHAQEIAEIGRTLPRARLFKAADTAILARERLAANVQLKFLMERLFLEMMGSMDHA